MFDYEVGIKEMELKRDMYYNDSLLLTYSIKYPQFYSNKFQKNLNRMNLFYKTKALQIQSYCENKLYKNALAEYYNSVENGYPIHTFEVVVVYDVTYNENCAISLYFDQYEYTGGAHGITPRYSDTWNIKKGRHIKLNDLFPKNFDYKTYIIDSIYKQIEREISNGQNQYFEDYKKLVVENFNANSFYLTPKGIVIYYQQYDIAPYASGIPEFLIPYTKGGASEPKC